MKIAVKSFVVSLIFLFFLMGITLYHSLNKDFKKEMIIKVERGDTIRSLLHKIGKGKSFNNLDLNLALIYARITGLDKIKRGTYLAMRGESLASFLKKVFSGRGLLVRVTIPEGYNIYQVAQVLQEKGVCSYSDFLKYAMSKLTAFKFNIPSDRVEGFLFPDTYEFAAGTNPMRVITTMIKNFWKHYDNKLRKRTEEIGWNVYEVVTLASIIQKETSALDEMPLISAVYHNRLKKGMLLQADPTVIYGLMPNFDGNLRKKDLMNRQNRWNTYIYKGLPPTPICNPGINAIRAALYPAKVNYLYFVSMGNGRHYFSTDYKDHLRAVRKYQLGR